MIATRYFQKCPWCGGKAFEYLRKPKLHDIIYADMVLFKGVHPNTGDEFRCQECGETIPASELNEQMLLADDSANGDGKNITMKSKSNG